MMEDILYSKKKFDVENTNQSEKTKAKYNYTTEILLKNLNDDKKRGALLEEALMRGKNVIYYLWLKVQSILQ